MKNKLKFLTVFAFLFSAISFAQSPWVRGKNNAFLQLGLSGIFYNQVEYNGNTINTNADFSDITTQLYTEYGVSNKLDFIAIVPYKTISYQVNNTNIKQDLSGISNITIGFKYLICDKKWKLSSGIYFSGNTTTYNDAIGLRTGFQSNTIMPYVSYGSSENKWYYFANLGYGYMSNDYSDFLKLGAEVGYKFLKNTHLIVNLDLRNPISDEDFYTFDSPNYAITSSYLDRQQYLGAGLKLNHEFVKDKYGINLGAIGALDLDNAPVAPSINFGLYAKF